MKRCAFSLHHLHRCSKMCDRCSEMFKDVRGRLFSLPKLWYNGMRGRPQGSPLHGKKRPCHRTCAEKRGGVSWICQSENKSACRITIIPPPAPISSPYARMKGAASFRPSPTLFDAVRVMKSLSTRLSRNRLGDCPLWQRSYHEHVIRNEDDY